MVDFTKLAEFKLEDIEKPKPLPLGTYEAVVEGTPKWGEAKFRDKETGEAPPMVTVVYRLVNPTDDVDQEDLAAMGGLIGKNGKPRTISQDFIFNGGAPPYSLRRFIEGFGIEGGTLAEALEGIVGEPVLVTVKHRLDEKTQDRYAQVDRAVANNR